VTPANILAAISDPAWWGPWFTRGDWRAWRSFFSATFALPMDDEAFAIYRECTGRTAPPLEPATEAWAICGRRGGKTRLMATAAAWLAAFIDWRPHLAPGEVATVMLIAKDRKQARTAFRYLRSLFMEHPQLAQLVTRETDEQLELSCRVVIEVTTASFRTTRGFTVCAVIADELAFWIDDESSANPADEVLDALRPAMATMPGALLMVATTPYARKGPTWDAYREHHGKTGDPILIWKAPTRRMNPLVPQKVIDDALEQDPSAAAAEYLAEFRSDVESFITREAIDAVTVPGRLELPRIPGVSYVAFVDMAGGSGGDSSVITIGYRDEDEIGVLVCIRESRPPHSPAETIAEFAARCKSYGIIEVIGDRFAGEFPREMFREHGISYRVAEKTKSAYYVEFLALANSRRVQLLDSRRLQIQLMSLERRVGRGTGRDSIDHRRDLHDDVANACAGVLVEVAGKLSSLDVWRRLGRGDAPPAPPTPEQLEQIARDAMAPAERLWASGEYLHPETLLRGGHATVSMRFSRSVSLLVGNSFVLFPAHSEWTVPAWLADPSWMKANGAVVVPNAA
jgi:hypothetical protein